MSDIFAEIGNEALLCSTIHLRAPDFPYFFGMSSTVSGSFLSLECRIQSWNRGLSDFLAHSSSRGLKQVMPIPEEKLVASCKTDFMDYRVSA